MPKSESSTRWYDRNTLQIVDEVLRATPKKIKNDEGEVIKTLTHRAPTLTDARKQFYLPSVTSIIKALINPESLVKWIVADVIKATAAFPYDGDGSEDDILFRYAPMITAKRKEYADLVQDKGKLLHKEKELFFMEGKEPETMAGKNIVIEYQRFMNEHGAKVECMQNEKPFGSSAIGYAGTPDDYMSDVNFINDLKTTKQKNYDSIKKSKDLYLSWKLQLGAYRIIAPGARLFQAVASYDSGEVKFIELQDPDLWAEAFKGMFITWCADRGYDPRVTA